MDNPAILATLDTRHRTTTKDKNTTQYKKT